MGIANIIPGVSGGTLAIILGIYEDFIGALSHFFKNFKKNLIFILPVGLGMLASIATMSNVIDYSLHKFTLATVMFFVGLVLGGIPLLLNKVKGKKDSKVFADIIAFIITFSIVIFMAVAKLIFSTDFSISFAHL